MESYDWDWEDDENIPDYEEDDSFEYLNKMKLTKLSKKAKL